MLLAPSSNASPPFCCPTHIETPTYDNDSSSSREGMPSLVKSLCQKCQNCPSVDSSEVGTLSATVAAYRTHDASSEGETSEYEDEDDETAVEANHNKAAECSEDYSSSDAPLRPSSTSCSPLKPAERVTEGTISPTPEPPLSSPSGLDSNASLQLIEKSLLPSILKKTSRRIKGVSRRRIRGLWGSHEDDPFAQLHDDILQSTLSFLSLADICIMSMVSHRWKYLACKESTFQAVDATEFIDRAFANFSTKSPPAKASRETAQALSNVLENHTPRALVIRNIGNRLCPDTYLPSLKGLRHLILHNFVDLTDTHVHVWMLSSTSGQGRGGARADIHLRSLELTDCPRISNAAVKTIARHCPNLQALSLAGNKLVDNVNELSSLLRVEGQSNNNNHLQRSSSNLAFMSTSSLLSLDAPPLMGTNCEKPAAAPLQPCWSEDTFRKLDESPRLRPSRPKDPPSQAVGGGMSSLFAPPASAGATKSGSLFQPPKKPASTLPQSPTISAKAVSSLFLPPPSAPPRLDGGVDKEISMPVSSLKAFNSPAVSPKVSSKSVMRGLFIPPKAQKIAPQPDSGWVTRDASSVAHSTSRVASSVGPGSSLGVMFQPPNTSSSVSTMPSSRPLSSKAGSSLGGMFQPPNTSSSVSTMPSSRPLSSKPLVGLFSAPPTPGKLTEPAKSPTSSSSSSPFSGLFSPPKNQSRLPQVAKDATFCKSGKTKFPPNLFIPPKTKSDKASSSLAPGSLFTPPTNPKPFLAAVDYESSLSPKDPSELNALFAPPPPSAEALSSKREVKSGVGLFVPPKNPDLEPPQSPSRNPAAAFESLFRPPGNSPSASPPKSNFPTLHRRGSSVNTFNVGRLDRIDLSGTNVSPQALLDAFGRALGKVSLVSLKVTETSNRWSEEEVRELSQVVSFAKLRLLSLEYESPVVAELVAHYSSAGLPARE